MSRDRLVIRGLSTISPLGSSEEECAALLRRPHPVTAQVAGSTVFPLTESGESKVAAVLREPQYENLDRTTALAIAAARESVSLMPTCASLVGCISIGSARGATRSLERSIQQHLEGREPLLPSTSPVTTAGNISSWVAQDILDNPSVPPTTACIGTSMTCTSAFHSLLVAHAFVRSGMAPLALFGGAEACLTDYTIAQLRALRIYPQGGEWPCAPCLNSERRMNSVTLGEAAGSAFLAPFGGEALPGDMELLALGWSLEPTPSATGVSEDGEGFAAAMQGALSQLAPGRAVDAVILHAPGTSKGDEAEVRAVTRLLPGTPLCTTKHLTGHSYGASGMVSLSMAQALLAGGGWSGFPYPVTVQSRAFEAPKTVLINAAGFGGNSISVIVGRPSLPSRT